MKYNGNNRPLVCMQTQSLCYRKTRPMTVRGVLWHSTGANNPNLCRYVQPSDDAADRDDMLRILGTNKYRNDINHTSRQMGVNAWIGRLASGEVATVQAMPWAYMPWGCGNGGKGSCNDGWIQFEICEDGLNDRTYAIAAYQEACELTAYLCRMFGIDPHGTVRFNGVTVPTIVDHRTSHLLGLGNNHGDIAHWFPKYGKTLDSVRDDVAALLAEAAQSDAEPGSGDEQSAQPDDVTSSVLGARLLKRGMAGDDVKTLQEYLNQLHVVTPALEEDGDFGPKTDAAVRAFQLKAGLVVDGLYGVKTHAALMNTLADALMNALTDVAKEKPKLTVLADTAVRAGNGERYAVIMTVEARTCLEYVATAQNDWHAVAVGGQVGWIPAAHCAVE